MSLALPPYTRRFSREFPGLFIILLDQSRSMSEPVQGLGCTKADFAATAINELIFSMIDQTPYDEETGERRKYAYLTILGYSDDVTSLLTPDGRPVPLPFLAANPRGYTTVVRDVLDVATGSFRQVQDDNRPYWITPHFVNGTQMDKAFERARDIVRVWLASPPEPRQSPRSMSFPPVIIHITDGDHNGLRDPEQFTNEIRSEGTQQGASLIFNCHFTAQMQQPFVFPASGNEVAHMNPFAPRMLEMSSAIPEPLLRNAADVAGHSVQLGARGFIYNGNIELLVKFMNWGTIGTGGFSQ